MKSSGSLKGRGTNSALLTNSDKMKHILKFISKWLIFAIIINLFSVYFSISISGMPPDRISDTAIHRKHENNCMKIALTFDDGPHPRYTPRILEILDEYGIKATFFTVGINAYYYPEALRMVAERGHEIGNHTYSHPRVSSVDQSKLGDEIELCEETIYGITDCRTKLFRPPEGMIDSGILNVLHGLDYRVILWDIDTRDWAHTPPKEIAENVINTVSSGDIILMHDYIGVNSPTCEAMSIFIPALIEKGYRFVVVSELIDTK